MFTGVLTLGMTLLPSETLSSSCGWTRGNEIRFIYKE